MAGTAVSFQMPPKKSIEIPLVAEPIDWVRIIQTFAAAIVFVMTSWVALTVNRVEAKVDKVRIQTDGVVTASKKAIAISAEGLAVATKNPKDIKIAEEAWEAYEAQLLIQQSAEQTK